MTNVMLDGGKEIDLLAIDPRSSEKYHIEVHCVTGRGFKIRLEDTQKKSGEKHKRGLDTLNEIKFAPLVVRTAIQNFFGNSDYKKVLVVWAVEKESIIQEAKTRYDNEVWKMSDILRGLRENVGTKAYRDDILRTIQLMQKELLISNPC